MTMRFGDSVSSKPARMFSLSEGQRIGLAYFLLLLVGGLWLIGIPAAAFCAVIALLVLAALSSAAFCGKLLFIRNRNSVQAFQVWIASRTGG